MSAKLSAEEWEVFEAICTTYALPDSRDYMDPIAFNRFLRTRVPPRGQRFNHDHRDTCAYIERSKNLNVVAYTANFIVPADSREAARASQPPSASDTAAGQEQWYCLSHYHNDPSVQRERRRQLEGSGGGWVPVPSGIGVTCRVDAVNPAHVYFVRLEPSYIAERRRKGIQGDCDELKMLERLGFGYNSKPFDVERQITTQLPLNVKKGSRLYALLHENGEEERKATLQALVSWWRRLPPLVMSFVPLPAWPMFGIMLKPLRTASLSLTSSPTAPAPPDNSQGPTANASSWCSDADTICVLLALVNKRLCILEKVYVKTVERWFGLPSAEYIEVTGMTLDAGDWTTERRDNNGQYAPPSLPPTEGAK